MSIVSNPIFQTVISGVFVFVVGDIVQNYYLKPWYRYNEIIGRIDNALKFYANVIVNPDIFDRTIQGKECSAILRTLSSDLEATRRQMVLRYREHDGQIAEAAQQLMGLSNSLGKQDSGLVNDERCHKIREALNIPTFEKSRTDTV